MRDAAYYREQAAKFRDLALAVDEGTARSLIMLAEEYEELARRAELNKPRPKPE